MFAINSGDLSVANLSSRGGTATIYNKIRDNADTFYSNILVPTGTLSIGTNTIVPSYKLSVEGNIHAQQVNVDMNGWADYVFGKNYALPSLNKVKAYINQNHLLPEMPSEKEIEKDGLNLGEMNKLLVEKVEELTLYLIDQDKQIKGEKNKNTSQENKLNVQREEINVLKKQMRRLIKVSAKN